MREQYLEKGIYGKMEILRKSYTEEILKKTT